MVGLFVKKSSLKIHRIPTNIVIQDAETWNCANEPFGTTVRDIGTLAYLERGKTKDFPHPGRQNKIDKNRLGDFIAKIWRLTLENLP